RDGLAQAMARSLEKHFINNLHINYLLIIIGQFSNAAIFKLQIYKYLSNTMKYNNIKFSHLSIL
ncbi:hypothetical protein, partial [Blautia sp.]|uniref:hypothetical protein n=1 Tax=Blautia sp. TaxID=1955243 RepID=UPI003AB22389